MSKPKVPTAAEVLAAQRAKARARRERYLERNPGAPAAYAARRREADRKLRARHEDEYQTLLAIEKKVADADRRKAPRKALEALRERHKDEFRDLLATTS